MQNDGWLEIKCEDNEPTCTKKKLKIQTENQWLQTCVKFIHTSIRKAASINKLTSGKFDSENISKNINVF